VPLLSATADVPTPALVADLGAVTRNVERAAVWFGSGRVRLRPHFKAHKCTRLLRLQCASGGCTGVTCATAHEAEVLALAGFTDILLANEVADPGGLAALKRAASVEGVRVTACVDDRRHVAMLGALGVALDVLVEVDVGQHRCGVAPGEALALARVVAGTERLRFRGLQGYEGHAVLLPERERRADEVMIAARILHAERAALEAAGLACELVSGGGTGTFDLSTQAGALDEIQAGSYVLMDASYGKLGLSFEQALFCRATVVSRQGTRLVLDAGLKALSAEYGMPSARHPGVEVLSLADEHATARVAASSTLAVGDAILLVPAHVDPTVNLHAALHMVAADGTVEAWAVDGRR